MRQCSVHGCSALSLARGFVSCALAQPASGGLRRPGSHGGDLYRLHVKGDVGVDVGSAVTQTSCTITGTLQKATR